MRPGWISVPPVTATCRSRRARSSLSRAEVRPRSGLAIKHGITVSNAPGTIDADYRGEVCVILGNIGREPFVVRRGMRIAQMVIAPVRQAVIEEVDELDDTSRGAGGFGHTGV